LPFLKPINKMKRLIVLLSCCLLLQLQMQAQPTLSWEMLAEVKLESKHDEQARAFYSQIVPSEAVRKLDGKMVIVKGYMLPMDVKDGYYILSAFPNSSCFFCGAAGEESVIELKFKGSPRTYKMDEVVSLKGRFRWNQKPFELPYILEEAEPYP